jgi:membrane-bound lytic murein transglycosylase D
MIERIFAEEGVPQELIYLAQAESAFMPRSVSNKQAVGMWQFIAETGANYKLARTSASDDRLDPEKSTRAAARYLRDLHQRYGDWYLAMAAYNCGPGVIEKAVERTGYADFWELRSRGVLPQQTANYVPIILAMTIVAKNAPEYGIYDLVPEKPVEYDTLPLDANVNLGLISDLTETPIPELQQLNPALLRGTAPEGYDLHVPKGMLEDVKAGLASVPAATRATARLHKVEPGESLADIAKQYRSTSVAIAGANGLEKGATLNEGDRLVIPSAYHETPVRAVRATHSRGKSAKTVRKASAKAPAKNSVTKLVSETHAKTRIIR